MHERWEGAGPQVAGAGQAEDSGKNGADLAVGIQEDAHWFLLHHVVFLQEPHAEQIKFMVIGFPAETCPIWRWRRCFARLT